MHAIFINYRRADDGAGQATSLYRDLIKRFGESEVFMDFAAIELGTKFRTEIETALNSCGVQLVVIGNQWLTITDEHGMRRLDNPNDLLRREIVTVLARGIPVIPVLVHKPSLPKWEALPADLRSLLEHQAF